MKKMTNIVRIATNIADANADTSLRVEEMELVGQVAKLNAKKELVAAKREKAAFTRGELTAEQAFQRLVELTVAVNDAQAKVDAVDEVIAFLNEDYVEEKKGGKKTAESED